MREYVLIEGCTIICADSALLHCTELIYFSIFVHIQNINNLAFCLSVNVRSMPADRRSDGAVMFITLMLGNDCCIFNITINKNPVAVFPLVGSACGSPNASDLQDSQLWGEKAETFLPTMTHGTSSNCIYPVPCLAGVPQRLPAALSALTCSSKTVYLKQKYSGTHTMRQSKYQK